MANANPVLHHINLKTTRLREMIDWYGIVVGTTPTFQFPVGAWLSNDGANHRIALVSTRMANRGLRHDRRRPDSAVRDGLRRRPGRTADAERIQRERPARATHPEIE